MKKYLSGIFALCVLAVLISFPAYALEISEKPVIIHEFRKDDHISSIATDGKYLLISEKKQNEKFSKNYSAEGYQWMGNLYLYDTANKTLTIIPGNIPAESATIVNSTIYWKSSVYRYPVMENGHRNMYQIQNYYQYIPGDLAPQKLDIPCDKPIGRFLTSEKNFITITGDPATTTISITNYPLPAGTPEIIPTLINPDPEKVLLNDNVIIYQGREKTTRNVIYVYSMSSGQTSSFEPEENEFRQILGASENIIIYLRNENSNPVDGNYQLRMLNITTGDTAIICDDPMYLYPAPKMKTMNYNSVTIGGPVILWSGTTFGSDIRDVTIQLYGYSLNENTGVRLLSENFQGWGQAFSKNTLAWIDTVDKTDITAVYMTELGIPQQTTQPQQTAYLTPSPTKAGTPIGMAIGTAAFILACVLAVLWRKK